MGQDSLASRRLLFKVLHALRFISALVDIFSKRKVAGRARREMVLILLMVVRHNSLILYQTNLPHPPFSYNQNIPRKHRGAVHV
jgi:hypothetical protein